jgi:hypothetical protein
LHAGLVILIPVVSRDVQRRLFKAALDELAVIEEPVNRALEPEIVARRHRRDLFCLPSRSNAENAVQWLFLNLNAFFASCEQQENPTLRGKPIVVVQT